MSTTSTPIEIAFRIPGSPRGWVRKTFRTEAAAEQFLPADYLAEIESGGAYATGMTPELARRLVAIAYRWHLNTCRAGCSHMTPLDHESSLGAVLWPGIRLVRYVGSGDPELPYGWRLAEDGLLEADPTTVMLRSLHCSVSDYRYGTAWLIELLPDDLLAELAGLGLTAPEVP